MGPERLKETALGSNHAVRRIGRWMRNSRPVVRAVAGLHLGGPVILRYHSVSDDPSWRGGYMQESLVVSPGVFDRQLAALKRRHRLTSVDDIVDRMRAGRSIDSRAVAVTFDDGYEDNHRVVFPILKKHGASATFYVTTGAVGDEDILWTVRLRRSIRTCGRDRLPLTFLGPHPLDVSTDEAKEAAVKMLTGIVKRCKREEIEEILREVHEAAGTGQAAFDRRTMMNWEEIRELHRAGMSIGAHTVSHFNLPSLDTSDVAREVIASKKELEDKLETEIRHFAYPNGRTDRHCDARVAKIVAMAGFHSAVTSLAGPVSSRYSEYCVPRLGVAPRHADIRRLLADIEYSKFKHQNAGVVEKISAALPGGNGSPAADGPRPPHDGLG
jgi:peptidoglycan/xylan/chitin deacetylase (PgdA/CDA1 family)